MVTRERVPRVLWVHRSEANPFLGGFRSFPGGRVAHEDGPTDEESLERTMMRCAVREAFEEIGLWVALQGAKPDEPSARAFRRELLDGKAEFWSAVERMGLTLDPLQLERCGRWITPPFSRVRFDTMFFVTQLPDAPEPDVWPGELASGEWVDPQHALDLWDHDRISLAMPTLHAFRVIAESAEDLPRRLASIPQANGVPSRSVTLNPGVVMVPLRTDTLPPATHTNAAVIGDRQAVVIDPGTADPGELSHLFEVVDRAIQGGGRVQAVLLTHRHKDHLLGTNAVRERYRAPVWAHEGVADLVRIDRQLSDGERIALEGPHPRSVLVVYAPGHSRSHAAFFEETSKTLCAGDVVSTLGTVVIDPPDGNMADYMATLERLRGLGAATVLPGHGPPNRAPERLFHALLEHRRMRESRILESLEGGPLSEEELRERVYRDTPDAPAALAARTLEAHLERLVAERLVVKESGKVRLSTP